MILPRLGRIVLPADRFSKKPMAGRLPKPRGGYAAKDAAPAAGARKTPRS
jgi:hypothetical protein